ncbi:MAG: hypothetical protein ACLFU2_04655, partial [Opitutales bacterium]
QAFLDALATGERDAADERRLRALRLVAQFEPVPPAFGPFRFGPAEARAGNLARAFEQNRYLALTTRAPWAIYNTSELMPYNPRGTPADRARQQYLWHLRAREVEAAPLLSLEAFSARLGLGRTADDAAALELTTEAAAQGYPEAQWDLGQRHLHGRGVEVDVPRALELLAAGARFSASRMADLAELYHEGERVPKDMAAAAKTWYARAVAAGDAHSASELGRFYEGGWAGTETDLARAAELFRLAANRGAYWGQFNLAELLLENEPDDEARQEGRFWLETAALDGHRQAIEWLATRQDLARDLDERRFWVDWAVAQGLEKGHLWTIGHYFSLPERDFAGAEKAAQRALQEGALIEGADALFFIYTLPESPLNDEKAAAALVDAYADEVPGLAARHALQLMESHGAEGVAEARASWARAMEDRERPIAPMLAALLLYPSVSEAPLDDLRMLLRDVSGELPGWGPLPANLGSAETFEEAQRRLAAALRTTDASLDALPPYTFMGRAAIALPTPAFPLALQRLVDGSSTTIVFAFNAEGVVEDASVDAADHALFGYLALEAVKRWRWEPADDPESEPVRTRIQIPFLLSHSADSDSATE